MISFLQNNPVISNPINQKFYRKDSKGQNPQKFLRYFFKPKGPKRRIDSAVIRSLTTSFESDCSSLMTKLMTSPQDSKKKKKKKKRQGRIALPDWVLLHFLFKNSDWKLPFRLRGLCHNKIPMATVLCINYQCLVYLVLILYVFKYVLSLFPHDLKMSRIGKRTSSCHYKMQCFCVRPWVKTALRETLGRLRRHTKLF